MAQTIEANGSSRATIRDTLQPSRLHGELDLPRLSTLQRILLTTDGTVTEVVEIYAGESMGVVKLAQDLVPIERAIEPLQIGLGRTVLSRKILLQGKISGDNFLYAESLIVPDRLDPEVQDGLLKGNKPIGYLIMAHRMETYREILEFGIEKAGPVADYFDIGEDDGLIFRTYRIFAGQHPIMMITEKFPESSFRA